MKQAVFLSHISVPPALPSQQLSSVQCHYLLQHYTVRKKCDCQKFYSLTIARKQQQQQPAPVYDDIVGQSQNIELKENVAYGPVQQ